MKTIKEAGALFQQSLQAMYPVQEIYSIYSLIINDLTGLSNAQIKAFPEQILEVEHQEYLKDSLLKLRTGEPVQYVLGKTEFYGLPFKVNPSVLIPRPETEELVDWLLNSLAGNQQFADPNGKTSSLKVLDIGTGSGCIAVSLKKNLPEAEVYALDVSAEALETARINASLNDTDVHFIHDDILKTSQLPILKHSSVIISNPPYVTPGDKMLMHQNVIDFEPQTALFVPQHDPLLFYRAIADFALNHLEKGGFLFFEINESYGQETLELLRYRGFRELTLKKDMQNKDRMIRAKL